MDNNQVAQNEDLPIRPITPPQIKSILRSWCFAEPADPDAVYTMLTITGIAVTGIWSGEHGEHYVAFALPTDLQLCGQLH